jgi:hypothetical protein
LQKLIENRANHVRDFSEAMAGYRTALRSKVDQAYSEAKVKLDWRYSKATAKIASMTDEDIQKQDDWFQLIDAVQVEMKVPRSFESEYDAAVDMAQWDIRETLELTHAEFACFIRDKWDWSSKFDNVSAFYKTFNQ